MLDVWSKPGAGTVFRLTIPRTTDAAAIVSPLPLEPDDIDATGPPQTGVVEAIDLLDSAADLADVPERGVRDA
jgi:two-component system, OmpR family, sensor histidine kinase MtrB